MSEITITKENFEKEVMQSDIPVLLDFWATWCGPCQRLAPIVAEIAEEYEGKLKVGKIDVDEQRDLAIDFRVSSIPYVVVMKDGKVVNTAMGYAPKESVVALLKDLIL
ncbi:MAG: thioredoxin [Clostridiales bacterium]|nr:thioredoxin [Candidatus Scatonaster coprocaballi]